MRGEGERNGYACGTVAISTSMRGKGKFIASKQK